MSLSSSSAQKGVLHPSGDVSHNNTASKVSCVDDTDKKVQCVSRGGNVDDVNIIPYSPVVSHCDNLSHEKQLPLPTFVMGTAKIAPLFPTNDNYFRTWRTTHRPAKRWRERKATHNQRVQITRGYVDRLLKILSEDGVQS